MDVISTTLVLAKFPLSVLLACLMVVFISAASVNLVTSNLHLVFPSLCDLPVVSHLPHCGVTSLSFEPSYGSALLDRADFPNLVKIQNIVLDELAAGSSRGIDLALNVKHAELAVKDLVAVVRASNLTMKTPLVEALVNFATDARTASRNLQRLSARINGAVDSIVSFNAYAVNAIESAQKRGATEARSTVIHTFQASMASFSSQITTVILDATEATSSLDILENRLLHIHELCVQEALTTTIALEDLLWELWTMLGGNQSKLRDLQRRTTVLKEVEQYRAVAVAYVAATTQTVLTVDAQLSDLRDRLMTSAIDPQDIPVEVHLASVERSLLRLQQDRSQQVPRLGFT
ncbi:hypothetical protein GSI_10046 [Ganoderma sinense ZZ0214-1]|uniref:Uncharacterized protein n=1 Tax=Ganoderma sinense ZZ0214-1 TaxID=1077348 RepID=A0A2G8S027_9APHY|nr:hypothetical protein GSI_10046 [Ganoderma sinense ZZ0214-1]